MTQISINIVLFKFLLILSIVYVIRFIVEFVFKLVQDNPEPLEISKTETMFMYMAISYIITYILI
jgi:hypothetical protein